MAQEAHPGSRPAASTPRSRTAAGAPRLRRSLAFAASLAWLAAGAVFGLESFGVPAFVAWRPVCFLAFLAINAFAAGVVVSEVVVALFPRWRARRVALLQSVAALVLSLSVLLYLEFVRTHAVTVY